MIKISVALCTYNGEHFLESQLESILNQTVSVDEIVICDDISTDGTPLLLQKYKQTYPDKFRIYTNEKNVGAKRNFQNTIEKSTGDIIFLSDQDDVWPREKVEEVLTVFKTNPHIKGVFTNGKTMDDPDRSLWEYFLYTDYMQTFLNESSLFEMILKNGAIVTGATMAIAKEAKKIIFPFHNVDKFWHDEWIALSLSSENTLFPLNKNLFNYRIHEQQQIGIYTDDYNNRISRRERFFKKEPEFYEIKDYIFYMHFRLLDAREIVRFFPAKNSILEKMEHEFLIEKKKWLRRYSFFYRKMLLMKWATEKRFEVSFKDVVNT